MDKTLNTWEMVKALMENPKLKAKTVGARFNEMVCSVSKQDYFEFKAEDIETKELEESEFDGNISLYDRWTIIKPPKKLKEMSFGEAIHHFYTDKILHCDDYKSCVTGETLQDDWSKITKEAYLGLWTVKGVYEDD